jgi:hypothetical protein
MPTLPSRTSTSRCQNKAAASRRTPEIKLSLSLNAFKLIKFSLCVLGG